MVAVTAVRVSVVGVQVLRAQIGAGGVEEVVLKEDAAGGVDVVP